MRNLTLGALIVAGGLLAALPFRRVSVPPSADDPNRLATGPTSSLTISSEPAWPQVAMESSAEASPELSPEASPGPSFVGGRPGAGNSVADRPAGIGMVGNAPSQPYVADRMWPQAIPSAAKTRARRSPMLPLTFEDLAVPLETPHYTDQRFDAVAPPQTSTAGRPTAGAGENVAGATHAVADGAGHPGGAAPSNGSESGFETGFQAGNRFERFSLDRRSLGANGPSATDASSGGSDRFGGSSPSDANDAVASGRSPWADGNASRSILQQAAASRAASSRGRRSETDPRREGGVEGRLTGQNRSGKSGIAPGDLDGQRSGQLSGESGAGLGESGTATGASSAEPVAAPRQRHWIRQPD